MITPYILQLQCRTARSLRVRLFFNTDLAVLPILDAISHLHKDAQPALKVPRLLVECSQLCGKLAELAVECIKLRAVNSRLLGSLRCCRQSLPGRSGLLCSTIHDWRL